MHIANNSYNTKEERLEALYDVLSQFPDGTDDCISSRPVWRASWLAALLDTLVLANGPDVDPDDII